MKRERCILAREMTALPKSRPERAAVLSKAVLRAADILGISPKDLARILGISTASVSRLASGARLIDPASKEGEMGLLLLRVFRSLDALLGGDSAKCRHWLRAENHHLSGVPAEMLTRVTGLVSVADYLDAMRGTA